jgi:hypothetical protein
MPSRSTVLRSLVVALLLGCGDAAGPEPRDQGALAPAPDLDFASATGPIRTKLDRLRRRLAPFHRFQVAADAGWSTQLTGCMADPKLGGMGFHYAKTALLDGTVSLQEPEALLYEPQEGGKLRLVAVEYIVPFDAWTRARPPRLLGQDFKRNEAFGIWALHIWLWRQNPSGRFADWNPHVHCP